MNRTSGIYASLFSGTNKPLTKEQQEEFDRETRKAEDRIAAMTEEEKAAAFEKLMRR